MESIKSIPCPLLKRLTDIVLSCSMLILCSPFYLFIAVLIKLGGLLKQEDRGSVFRYEIRISQGEPFKFYKFRTIKQQVLDREKVIRIRDRAKTMEKDMDCTTVGKYLKKWYLDELPQIYNILRGDMSWVGPRPFPVDDYEEDLSKGDFRKKVIRTGLTGPVQIHKGIHNGRTDREMDEEYIEKHRQLNQVQMWFYDMGILMKTFRVIVQGKGL